MVEWNLVGVRIRFDEAFVPLQSHVVRTICDSAIQQAKNEKTKLLFETAKSEARDQH